MGRLHILQISEKSQDIRNRAVLLKMILFPTCARLVADLSLNLLQTLGCSTLTHRNSTSLLLHIELGEMGRTRRLLVDHALRYILVASDPFGLASGGSSGSSPHQGR